MFLQNRNPRIPIADLFRFTIQQKKRRPCLFAPVGLSLRRCVDRFQTRSHTAQFIESLHLGFELWSREGMYFFFVEGLVCFFEKLQIGDE